MRASLAAVGIAGEAILPENGLLFILIAVAAL